MDKKRIAIIGGGTVSWIGSHLALTAPAYGSAARQINELCRDVCPEMETDLFLTKMAGGISLETNQDISEVVDNIVADDVTKIVFFTAAMVDFDGDIDCPIFTPGKYGSRLTSSAEKPYILKLKVAEKIIKKVRETRKDIFLVGFKQTCGLTEDEQYLAGLDLCKRTSCNLVLANDVKTRLNMVVSPEEARYHVTENRSEALRGLVTMAKHRSHLTFTRSTVVAGEPVSWDSDLVPESLRQVVDHCIEQNAYKPFNGVTTGHFAAKLDDKTFLTSQRRTNFNDLSKIGLVKIRTDGPDSVVAYGSKPSVGGQSQRIVFNDHPDVDCILHFHCPLRDLNDPDIPQVSQYEVECGSIQCGTQTSKGLKKIGNLLVVYLKEHGPNIVFNRDIDPQEVISFINKHFDLAQKTGGFVSINNQETNSNWTPFRRVDITAQKAAYHQTVEGKSDAPAETWENNRYQVLVRRNSGIGGMPDVIHLSIRSLDRSADHDWRHLQRIKNEILGPEIEAVELYPAESRLVDTSNQYHLWAFDIEPGKTCFPFGYSGEQFVFYEQFKDGLTVL